jgi:hypothetical protein
MLRAALLLELAILVGGCARYEFDIVEPPHLARHIGGASEGEAVIRRDDLDYRMSAYEGRLVLRIANSSEDPIELLGAESYVVDPGNQSHPLASQSIAPHSFIKLILPPLRPIYRAEPVFGFGVSASRGLPDRQPRVIDDAPPHMILYDDAQTYWAWEGESAVRLRLAWKAGPKPFYHDFAFNRKKM